MKLHVKCDRCGTFVEGVQEATHYPVLLPRGWTHLRFFEDPVMVNAGLPDGPLKAELCATCTVIVQRATQAAIDRKT